MATDISTAAAPTETHSAGRRRLPPECMLVLLAAPKANEYYAKLRFEHNPRAWLIKRAGLAENMPGMPGIFSGGRPG